MDRDHRHAELGDVFLDVEFTGAGLRRRQQRTVRGVRCILEAFVGTVNTDEHLDLIVIRSDVIVAERPVKAETVTGVGLEVVGAVAERDATPVISASAEHAGTPPVEALLRVGRRLGVRFTRDFPAPFDGGVMEAERLLPRAHAAQRSIRPGLEHWGLGDRIVITAGLKHEDLHAVHGEGIG
jgi:hypothetical protein